MEEVENTLLRYLFYQYLLCSGCRVAPCESDGLINETSQDSRVQIHAFRTYGF